MAMLSVTTDDLRKIILQLDQAIYSHNQWYEDDLYVNLDWLCEHQAQIERALFRRRYDGKAPRLSSLI